MFSRLLGTLPGMTRILALLPQKRYGRGRYSVVARGSMSPLNYNGERRSVGMGREKYKYLCSEQMVQWFQGMFIIEQIK